MFARTRSAGVRPRRFDENQHRPVRLPDRSSVLEENRFRTNRDFAPGDLDAGAPKSPVADVLGINRVIDCGADPFVAALGRVPHGLTHIPSWTLEVAGPVVPETAH